MAWPESFFWGGGANQAKYVKDPVDCQRENV